MVDSLEVYNECKEFHSSVASGEIKATAVADEIDQAPSVDATKHHSNLKSFGWGFLHFHFTPPESHLRGLINGQWSKVYGCF